MLIIAFNAVFQKFIAIGLSVGAIAMKGFGPAHLLYGLSKGVNNRGAQWKGYVSDAELYNVGIGVS